MYNKKIGDDLSIYIVGGTQYSGYINWFPRGALTFRMQDADLVLFAGGEDVHPSYYNEPVGSFTQTNINRDTHEEVLFRQAVSLKKPILGICRGSQLCCVLSGGRLVQHQQNPVYIHSIQTWDDENFEITSTHHQAQYPYDMPPSDYKLIAWTEGMSDYHLNGENKEISEKPFKEAEIVYYPQTRVLGIQGHPEGIWRNRERYADTFEYLHNLVNQLLINKI